MLHPMKMVKLDPVCFSHYNFFHFLPFLLPGAIFVFPCVCASILAENAICLLYEFYGIKTNKMIVRWKREPAMYCEYIYPYVI